MDSLDAPWPAQSGVCGSQSPASPHGMPPHCRSSSPAFVPETLQIAGDMLYVILPSGSDLIRVNGGAAVEKIRLVGAAVLELIANNPTRMRVAEKYHD